MAKKKNYIGWIVSTLYPDGSRRFEFHTLSERRGDAIQNYLNREGSTWRGHPRDRDIMAECHKVTCIEIA